MKRWRRPIFSWLTVLAMWLAVIPQSRLLADCNDCKPGLMGRGWDLPVDDDTNICFTYDFTGDEQADGLSAAIGFWEEVFDSYSEMPSPNLVDNGYDCSNADIIIDVRPPGYFGTGPNTIAEASGPPGTSFIHVNANFLGNSSTDFWSWLIAHELGHLQDFGDVNNGGCAYQTVMTDPLNEAPPSFPSAGCPDRAAVTTKYWGGAGGASYSGNDTTVQNQGGYECTFLWQYEDYYYRNANGEWVYYYTVWTVIWYSCIPI